MRLTDPDRELLERTLDSLMQRLYAGEPPTVREVRDYEKAVRLVRELPPGERRVRSDFRTKRPGPQAEIEID